jgi:predicted nucleotidyltransferase
MPDRLHDRFTRALDALVAELQQDRSILAAILCGSLSHDTVWEKSDIDLVLVTIDDKQVPEGHAGLYADGLNVHASLTPRAAFRRIVEGAVHNSFIHSLLAKGRLLYTHDESIATLCNRLHDIGQRDTELQLLAAATAALAPIDKARKWFVTRGDLDYSALWILYAAGSLARIEVIARRLVADREVLPQAARLNPAFFKTVYQDLLNRPKTPPDVEAALAAIDAYLAERAPSLFKPIVDYLREAGEIRSATDIEAHFTRNFNVRGVTMACEYLADRRILGKASAPIRLTKRSNIAVQELAFFFAGGPPEESVDKRPRHR